MKEYKVFINFYKTENGGRKSELPNGVSFRPILVFNNKNYACQIDFIKDSVVFPGDTTEAIMRTNNCLLKMGDKFYLRELKEIASGNVITEI